MERLAQGTLLTTDTGEAVRVLKLLGAGGQGEVYEVDQNGQRYALKWYFAPTRDPKAQLAAQQQRDALKSYLIPRGAPDQRFVWPLDFVEGEPGSGTFGYLMRLWPAGYETLERLVCGRVPTTDRVLATAALGIVDAFRKLHLSGSVYKDVNLGGFAFDPKTGDVLIVDNDNVRTNGTPGAILFPGFGAPEVVMGRAPCTSTTDDHSLAVLLFYLFCRGNPMEGAKELVNCYDLGAMRELFGDTALFVFDPKDAGNRPVAGVHEAVIKNWPALPTELRAAFERAFGQGLHDPSKRLTDGEWMAVLSRFRDSLFECSSCRRETVYARESLKDGASLACVWCGRPLSPPPRMKIGAHVVMLSPQARVFPHHLGATADFTAPVGALVPHPSKKDTWGLQNLSKRPWSYTGVDGSIKDVQPGQAAPIRDGQKINFGPIEGEIRA